MPLNIFNFMNSLHYVETKIVYWLWEAQRQFNGENIVFNTCKNCARTIWHPHAKENTNPSPPKKEKEKKVDTDLTSIFKNINNYLKMDCRFKCITYNYKFLEENIEENQYGLELGK